MITLDLKVTDDDGNVFSSLKLTASTLEHVAAQLRTTADQLAPQIKRPVTRGDLEVMP